MKDLRLRLLSSLAMIGMLVGLSYAPPGGSVLMLASVGLFLVYEWWNVMHIHVFRYLGIIYIMGGLFPFLRMASEGKSWISVMAIAWIVDTAAYFGGSWFKGPKLAPRLSPGKTISGFLWGVGAGCLWIGYASTGFPFWSALPLTCITQAGDLLQSWVKRYLKIKDMGSIIPGHGGGLDRFDSTLALGWCCWLRPV